MEAYQQLIEDVLDDATYKQNRTAVDTLSSFSQSYKVDLQEGYPLLTTKQMDTYRWNSMSHELDWYLSGQEHIRDLQEETTIWDAWADDDGQLDTAYSRFWRRFPMPDDEAQLPGEHWSDNDDWIIEEENGTVFDQIQYVRDMLQDNPESRRIVVTAWHPGNAAGSTLPPCHYTFACNVQDGELNTHLTQRSGDIGLGVPFNIASYSLLTHLLADDADLDVGEFSHTIVDSHLYCGKEQRGSFYDDHLEELKDKIETVHEDPETLQDKLFSKGKDFIDRFTDTETIESYSDIADWIEAEAPAEDEPGHDHVPQLLRQLDREPYDKPTLDIGNATVDDFDPEAISIKDYQSHSGIDLEVAE